jgi:hypothetical protein
VWSDAVIDKLVVAQRLLARLRAAGAALQSGPGDELAPDAGWELADAAVIARALAGLTVSLPEVVATLKTAVDHAGTPVEVDGYFEAMRAAEELVAHTHRMAHNLDPHYGPHGRHPHRRRSPSPDRFG